MPVFTPLSMYDPIHFGVDEFGHDFDVTLMYRSLLIGGLPGAGKSTLINTIVAHAALSRNCQLRLIDGKLVELSPWKPVAHTFVGADLGAAIAAMADLAEEVRIRYMQLDAVGRRKIEERDELPVILAVIDELAYFTAMFGTEDEHDKFLRALMYVVGQGRAVGVLVVAATQRPSADIVPTRVRDIFGYRVAFRCATESSSDIILGTGWADEGHTATAIPDTSPGVGLALAEEGTPQRFKSGYLSDSDVADVVAYATRFRATG
jgi:S-DNA-T family DNA segregation ATPase FtsK/SpoIIIE